MGVEVCDDRRAADYHVYTGKLPELVRLYAQEGIEIQQEVLGGFVGAFTTEVGALSTYSSLWRYDELRRARATSGELQARADWKAFLAKMPAADPHPAEPHPRPDAVLADRMSVGALDGKVAVVTGGAQGIGRAIADGLAAEGARIVDRRSAEVPRRQPPRYPGGVGLTVDVASEADVERMVGDDRRALRRRSTCSSTTPASTRRSRCARSRRSRSRSGAR